MFVKCMLNSSKTICLKVDKLEIQGGIWYYKRVNIRYEYILFELITVFIK